MPANQGFKSTPNLQLMYSRSGSEGGDTTKDAPACRKKTPDTNPVVRFPTNLPLLKPSEKKHLTLRAERYVLPMVYSRQVLLIRPGPPRPILPNLPSPT